MSAFTGWYHTVLTRRPILTQALTAGTLFGVGDLIAQQGFGETTWSQHDWKRTGRLMTYGTLGLGPAIAVWYRFLNANVQMKSKIGTTVARMTADQFLFAPTNLVCFFTAMGLMEGKSTAEIKKKFQTTYLPTLKANFILWPPIQLANFYFVPLNYQSLVVNTVALGWNTYLSFANASGDKSSTSA
ncbi:putative integral membrane protein, Mpv17/PMP22 family [Phlyctochytrium arcticum]|nr:putative integral membrane protein, Mpv17/PMP22 family [Phlyctochytrium arcticum]